MLVIWQGVGARGEHADSSITPAPGASGPGRDRRTWSDRRRGSIGTMGNALDNTSSTPQSSSTCTH